VDIARTSLAANSALLQAPYMFDYAGRKPFDEPSGPHQLGEHALYRVYPTQEGHIFVAASPERDARRNKALTAVSRATGLHLAEHMRDEDMAQVLLELLHRLPTQAALTLFQAAGVTAVRMNSLSDLRKEYCIQPGARLWDSTTMRMVALGTRQPTFQFYRDHAHPLGSGVTMFAPCAIRSMQAAQKAGAEAVFPMSAPKYGAHTDEVLGTVLGYTESEVESMVRRGVAARSWSEYYLPGGDPWVKVKREYSEFIRNRVPAKEQTPQNCRPEPLVVLTPATGMRPKRSWIDTDIVEAPMVGTKRGRTEGDHFSWAQAYNTHARGEE